jgi:hypothetical protein
VVSGKTYVKTVTINAKHETVNGER